MLMLVSVHSPQHWTQSL